MIQCAALKHSGNDRHQNLIDKEKTALVTRAVADLALASYAGALIYPALFFTIIYATGYQAMHPTFTIVCLCVMVMACVGRLLLAVDHNNIETGVWVRWFSLLTLVMVSTWSSFWAFAIYTDGLNQTTLISIAASVGIASAGMGTLAPFLKLSYAVMFVLMWPSGLVLTIQPDGVGTAYAVMLLIGSFFLSFVNIRMHKQYWDTRKNEALLEERAVQLADATSAKSEFLARMSHEIRTPLNGILGMTQMLQQSELNRSQKKYTDIIRKSGEGLLTIINDILDLSRIEAGKFELLNAPLDIVNIVNETLELLEPEANRRGLTLTCEIAADVPGCLLGDDGRIRQILINLVGNAIKFTDEGSVSVRVTTQSISAHQANIYIEVADTGIGISAAARGKIFEAFCQEDVEQGHHNSGTGLGLAITRQLVSMMDGSIEVDNNRDRGTVFILQLPMNIGSEQEKTAMTEIPAHTATLANNVLTDKSILIAEDNLVNQFYATEILKSMGCRVTTANDGALAVEACDTGQFDAILMDMHMPNLNGVDATRAIRDMEGASKRTPIIAVTANAQVGERENCINAGLDDFISKPYSVPELQSVLVRWLGQEQAHTENNPLH